MVRIRAKKKTAKVRLIRQPRAMKSDASVGAVGKALRTLGGLGGGALGGYLGNPIAGGAVGNSLGGALSKWLGYGDYAVDVNSVVTKTLRPSGNIPAMHNDNQSIVVRHKEYLGEVRSSQNFQVQQSFVINPGNGVTFPWLADIAIRFQEYKIRGLVFHYVPSSGAAVSGANPALGTVMLQTSYRGTDSPPSNKVEMLNEYNSNESVPAEPFAHPIECDPKENPFNIQYVRSGDVPAEDSRLMYDLGVTHLAVSGQQTTGNVMGDLWVTYEIELKKPIVSSNVTSPVSYFMLQASGAVIPTNYFDFTQTTTGNVGLVCAGKTVTFPKGSVGLWILALRITSAGTFSATTFTSDQTYSNCSIAFWNAPSALSYSSSNVSGVGAGSLFVLAGLLIVDPAVTASFTYGTAAWTGTASAVSLTVTQSL